MQQKQGSYAKIYNKTTIPQLGILSVTINHKNKHKFHKFFVVPGNGLALLSMPDIEALNNIALNYSTIDRQASHEQFSKMLTDSSYANR